MPGQQLIQDLFEIDEIFRDFLFCILVPDNENPQDIIALFDYPEKLEIMIDFEVTIICLKEYQQDVLHLLRELHSDILEPINDSLLESRIVN